jgi:hypothetical protein
MVKEKITKFTCDTCGNMIDRTEEEGFPYEKGWMYLYRFEGQVGKNPTHRLMKDVERYSEVDKHFCQKKCLYSFVGKTITEASQQEVEDVKQYPPQMPIPPTPPNRERSEDRFDVEDDYNII